MAGKRNPKNPNGGTSRAAIQSVQHEQQAIMLRLQGWTTEAIAQKLGYASHSGVRAAILRAMKMKELVVD
jgi:hypothetical protein